MTIWVDDDVVCRDRRLGDLMSSAQMLGGDAEVRKAIADGRVQVNGVTVKNAGAIMAVGPNSVRVRVPVDVDALLMAGHNAQDHSVSDHCESLVAALRAAEKMAAEIEDQRDSAGPPTACERAACAFRKAMRGEL